ncbi:hypothetical protein NCF86_00280 [Pelagerythrobacter marinus]|nr:hypothetical protein NCF86_00280 [Pelagerythrobacter marinus]
MTSETTWIVLRCPSSKTLTLANRLASYGAWTPTWRRQRRLPRSNVRRLITEACIPSFVFVPEDAAGTLPKVPLVSFSVMRVGGKLVRIADRSLEPLRNISEKAPVPARLLPKPGTPVRFASGPFQGLQGTVRACTQSYATVDIVDFVLPVKVPPCLLQKVRP